MFKKAGYRVASAANGLHATTKLKSGFVPRLILTDLIMPGMNGHDFIKALRADPVFKDLPVMLMTGTQERALIMDTVNLGVVNLFIKPLNFTDLLKKIENFYNEQKTEKIA
jgi:two-component system chemotaxis response regulator CheY